jgi:ornithine cyclodeaminase
MLVLNAADVRQALPMLQAIEAMKRAFAALTDGRAEVPLRTRLPIPAHDGLSLFMSAFASSPQGEALAVKVVSLFPQNPSRGLAYIQAAVLVLEPDTGRALAILEGSTLTAIRTGAAGGAAADLLARPESHVVAVIGAGVQGRTQLEAVCTVRKIEQAWIYDSDPNRARGLAAELSGRAWLPVNLQCAADPRQAISEADVICTATTSLTPVFDDRDLKPGAHISAVGSYTPEMQEVPPQTVKRARVVVDSRLAALIESGDLIQPIRNGLFGEDHVYAELGEIILGLKAGRQSAQEITYFKSVGIAVQDALAAQLAVENARKMGLGQEVPF